MIDLPKLFADVFDPQPGETALVLVDTPHGHLNDTPDWAERRAMASRWHSALALFGQQRGFRVLPLVSYAATGAHNASLPPEGLLEGAATSLGALADQATLVLALTQFSASAPLIEWTTRRPNLRAASMPMVAPAMEATALAADYAEIARSCAALQQRLKGTALARITFSNGDRLQLDLRFRTPHVDDGQLRPSKTPPRLVNLPSGEAYIACYEGEHPNLPSQSRGVLPMIWRNEIVRVEIAQNRVVEVLGRSDAAADLHHFLSLDGARRNVAELGLGCNTHARVWGNVLEDEKAGPHIALGRSDHIGGTVGLSAFDDPRYVWHHDFVFARESPISVRNLTLISDDNRADQLVFEGDYLLNALEVHG